MKIGVITFFKVNNYGAELQAYALQRKLSLMGFDAELIDYPFYKHEQHQKSRLSAPVFEIGLLNRVKERIYPCWQQVAGMRHRRPLAVRKARMDEFHRRYTGLSPQTYRTIDDLYSAVHPYDVFIVGSDQVWNPRMNTSIEPYFLTFAPPGKRRIAYASSFGVSVLPESVKVFYAQRLSAFHAISVREKQGVAIVRELIGRQADQVLDPTLLLDAGAWSAVAQPPARSDPYVLVYELSPCPAVVNLARRVAKICGAARIVRLCGMVYGRRENGIEDVLDAGPAEFVGLFSRATFVVTNSFHGTAFAVNHQTPFFSVIPERMKNASRISSLLELTGLNRRMIAEDRACQGSIEVEVDFTRARTELARSSQASVSFLSQALTG